MEWIEFIIKAGGFIGGAIAIWKIVSAIVRLSDDMRETKEYVMNNIISIPIPEVSESDEKETATPMSRRRT